MTTLSFRAVPAVRRAALILKFLSERPHGATLDEIARSLRLPKSSALAICRTMVLDGLLVRDEAGWFRTGLEIVALARRYLQDQDLPGAFNAALDNEPPRPGTTQLAVLQGADVLYLARRDGSAPVQLSSFIGGRLPASTTAAGKAILAELGERETRELLGGDLLPRLTAKSLGNFTALLADLAETRRRGYAIDDEETMEGVICVGAPIYGFGETKPIAALSSTMMKAGSARQEIRSKGRDAVRLARVVSKLLGSFSSTDETAEELLAAGDDR